MGKIRIYELAKELGVENKVVLTKITELGIGGKTSHSHSLEDDEADMLRRTIIRQAIGSTTESKVVTTLVDKSTGEKRTVVQSRKGNVIRRRKNVGDSGSEEDPVTALPEDQSQVPQEGVPSESPLSALDEANALFARPDSAEVREAPGKEEENIQAELSVPTEEVQAEGESPGISGEDEAKKTGPRILGRIDLPQAAAPRGPAKRRSETSFGNAALSVVPEVEEEERRGKGKGKSERSTKGGDERRRSKKLEFSRTDLLDYEGLAPRRAGKGTKKSKEKTDENNLEGAAKVGRKVVRIDESITVGELARQLSLKAGEVISKLFALGMMATINQVLDKDTATIVAEEFGAEVTSISFDETSLFQQTSVDPELLKPRSPVVTVMGHVDHGKTSLLDYIREASVAAKEHGGITQHIGAYSVQLADGRRIAFLDTPGHAAFTEMRARGAHVTDIVVLVVAADDGVMPQTIEAIAHAKAAGVAVVVAVNKMDKAGIQPDRVKQQLAEQGLQPEDWGGDTMFFPVSAKTGQGIPELLEGILLQAEVLELKADANGRARGVLIEARQERGRGTVATVLVQAGTLRIGDLFVAGSQYGRVRSMLDHFGSAVQEAGPSTPVEISGFSDMPAAGDDFIVMENEANARQVASNRQEKLKLKAQAALAGGPISLEEFSRRTKVDEAAELNVIVKADVHGSLEAVRKAVEDLSREQVRVKVIHGGVGGITESDVQLALASRAIILGFNVRAEARAYELAEGSGVDLRFYRIIYELVDEVKQAMAGLLEPVKKESILGHAEVREVFVIPKIGAVAGGYVTDGLARRGSLVRLLRDSIVIYEGKMLNLRRFKEDAKEVQHGYECGISLEGYNDIKQGDVIEIYEIQEIAATLE